MSFHDAVTIYIRAIVSLDPSSGDWNTVANDAFESGNFFILLPGASSKIKTTTAALTTTTTTTAAASTTTTGKINTDN
jgi:hypothetical protein